jgi:hypothetical protein
MSPLLCAVLNSCVDYPIDGYYGLLLCYEYRQVSNVFMPSMQDMEDASL